MLLFFIFLLFIRPLVMLESVARSVSVHYWRLNSDEFGASSDVTMRTGCRKCATWRRYSDSNTCIFSRLLHANTIFLWIPTSELWNDTLSRLFVAEWRKSCAFKYSNFHFFGSGPPTIGRRDVIAPGNKATCWTLRHRLYTTESAPSLWYAVYESDENKQTIRWPWLPNVFHSTQIKLHS